MTKDKIIDKIAIPFQFPAALPNKILSLKVFSPRWDNFSERKRLSRTVFDNHFPQINNIATNKMKHCPQLNCLFCI